ncbi:hypothetical protein [Advenella sp. S44]|nr:hypothetical protein [Advenella sp. S44]
MSAMIAAALTAMDGHSDSGQQRVGVWASALPSIGAGDLQRT